MTTVIYHNRGQRCKHNALWAVISMTSTSFPTLTPHVFHSTWPVLPITLYSILSKISRWLNTNKSQEHFQLQLCRRFNHLYCIHSPKIWAYFPCLSYIPSTILYVKNQHHFSTQQSNPLSFLKTFTAFWHVLFTSYFIHEPSLLAGLYFQKHIPCTIINWMVQISVNIAKPSSCPCIFDKQ